MKSLPAQFLSALLCANLLASPAAFPQQTPQQQSQQPTQQPSATQTNTQAGSQSSTSSSSPASVQPPALPAGQTDSSAPTNVKPGSEADVNTIGNRGVGHGLDFYSLEKEIALGKQLSQQVDQTAKFVNDPLIVEYVNRVGQNLVRNSDAQVPFTIKVIDSDEVNAFALPGGFFYVNSGLILHADEESELAGVMAHEIAHVAARHGTKNATKGQIAQMATLPLILFGPVGWAGYGIYEGLNFALPITFLKFSRSAEAEADYLGLQYMYKAGYDPNSFVTFFEKIEAEERKRPGTIPKIFDSHPPTPDRVVAAQKEIATILPPRPEYIVSTSDFDQMKRRLQSIQYTSKAKAPTTGNKPSLRKRTEQAPTTTTTTNGGTNGNGSDSDDSDRPTLKRRTDDGSSPNSTGSGSGSGSSGGSSTGTGSGSGNGGSSTGSGGSNPPSSSGSGNQ